MALSESTSRLVQRLPRAGAPDPLGNRLLAALSDDGWARLQPLIEVVALERQQLTSRYRMPMYAVDFPIDAVMSVVATLANGGTCEVATVGHEGFVEVDAALASRIAHRSASCQIPGYVARMTIDAFRAEMDDDPEFKTLVMRAVRARVFMTEQLATCNLKHTVIERFARWLLMTRDRLSRSEFNVTHEFLAMMLGARRAGVSQAAATLQTAGCIAYRRGLIIILDDAALTGRACECYAAGREAIEMSFVGDA
ncbi:MAG: Crp/Fnr family transcriptional regulator [Candidatus Eremiobacteraeota bacterium]|nr:Crp/Fnr family transcriptional regulator [Candidatus Eremiobacteraeota bacterium]